MSTGLSSGQFPDRGRDWHFRGGGSRYIPSKVVPCRGVQGIVSKECLKLGSSEICSILMPSQHVVMPHLIYIFFDRAPNHPTRPAPGRKISMNFHCLDCNFQISFVTFKCVHNNAPDLYKEYFVKKLCNYSTRCNHCPKCFFWNCKERLLFFQSHRVWKKPNLFEFSKHWIRTYFILKCF